MTPASEPVDLGDDVTARWDEVSYVEGGDLALVLGIQGDDHIWLSPETAKRLVQFIEAKLGREELNKGEYGEVVFAYYDYLPPSKEEP